jgi:tRNA (guanine-N7-)-methyltransferase
MTERPGWTPDTLPLYELPPDPDRLDVLALFQTPAPIELEVGSGKGLFLANAGSARPGHNFLGIEISRKYARRAAERIAKAKLANVAVLHGDVRRLWERADGLVDLAAVHVYFPDPWWKKRHKKRRVFNGEFLAHVSRVLRDGGLLHIATDVEEYFETMQAVVNPLPEFERLSELPGQTPDSDYLTNFERKYRIEGRPIYRTAYRFERLPALMNPEHGTTSAPGSSGGA